jgi:hypothetical protein
MTQRRPFLRVSFSAFGYVTPSRTFNTERFEADAIVHLRVLYEVCRLELSLRASNIRFPFSVPSIHYHRLVFIIVGKQELSMIRSSCPMMMITRLLLRAVLEVVGVEVDRLGIVVVVLVRLVRSGLVKVRLATVGLLLVGLLLTELLPPELLPVELLRPELQPDGFVVVWLLLTRWKTWSSTTSMINNNNNHRQQQHLYNSHNHLSMIMSTMLLPWIWMTFLVAGFWFDKNFFVVVLFVLFVRFSVLVVLAKYLPML